MIYSDFTVPSKNMNISLKEVLNMTREQNEELAKKDSEKILEAQTKDSEAREKYAEYMNRYVNEQEDRISTRTKFLEEVKDSFLSAAMFKLFRESCTEFSNRDAIVAKNLIKSFIKEQGAGVLLNRFKYENVLLGEMARIVNKAYQSVVESISSKNEDENKPNEVKELKLDTTIVDDFYKDLSELDTVDASKLIKDRVSDAISEFIDRNMNNKLDYEEIIQTAQERIETAKDESAVEYYSDMAKRQINEMRNSRYKNIFQYLVEAITKETFKDQTLKTMYVHESTVDMDAVVNSARLIYTMLEMQHTTNMVPDNYIKEYIASLSD